MVSFGIEEEFVYRDTATLGPAHVAPTVQHELFQLQIDFASPVFSSREESASSLVAVPTALKAAAVEHRAVVACIGKPFYKSRPLR